MKKIILEIHGQGMHLGNTGGLLLLRQQGKWRQFPFADVQISEHEIDKYPQIIHIPPGTYLCKKSGSQRYRAGVGLEQSICSKEGYQAGYRDRAFYGELPFFCAFIRTEVPD